MSHISAILFYGSMLGRVHVNDIQERSEPNKLACMNCNNRYPDRFKFCPQCSKDLVAVPQSLHVDTVWGEPPDGAFTACRIEHLGSEYYIVVAASVVRDGFGEGYLPEESPTWNHAIKEFMKILHIADVPAPKWRLIAVYG